MKKELKEQIKQDDFASGLERAMAWIGTHRDELRIGVGVAVVLAAAIGAAVFFRAQRAREADRAFLDALASFEAPVATELPEGSARPSGTVFASPEEKYKTAAAAFDGVERRYGASNAGQRAKYYGAVARIHLGQYPEAEKALSQVQSSGRKGLDTELARLALANAYRRSGQTDKALDLYRGLAGDSGATVPRDFALLCAAQTLEDAKQWAEARATYRRLLEEFPASAFASQATTRAEYLQSAVQG